MISKRILGCLLALLMVTAFGFTAADQDDPPQARRGKCCQGESAESGEQGGPGCQAKGKGQGAGKAGGCGGGCGGCGGHGKGRGAGGGGRDATFEADHEMFFFLLDHREQIRRKVEMREDGIETLTESDDPEVAGMIMEHVEAMYDRIEEGRPIHQRDPLFAELFRHVDKIEMKVKRTRKGVRVTETSKDPEVAKLIQAHAEVVSGFLENGYEELHRNHAVPGVAGDEDAAGDDAATTGHGQRRQHRHRGGKGSGGR